MVFSASSAAGVCGQSLPPSSPSLHNDGLHTWHRGSQMPRRFRTAFMGSYLLEKRPGYNFNIGTKRFFFRTVMKNETPKNLAVSATALEPQPSLKRWNSKSSFKPFKPSRWEVVKDRNNPKGQNKPKRPNPKTEENAKVEEVNTREEHSQTVRIVPDFREGDGEEHLGEGLRGVGEALLRKAKKQAIFVADRLKKVDLKMFFSTTADATHTTPFPPFTGSLIAGLGAVMIFGLFVDMLLWKMSKSSDMNNVQPGVLASDDVGMEGNLRSRAPSALSVLLEGDLRRKESVEWLNMVIGKLWNLYRRGIENWLVGLLQPIIDDLKKPDYVKKVQVKQFFLGDEPLSVRTVERRTSRRADDLQYHIGVRYTGGARLLLLITLKWGIIPLTIPVGVRGLDVDAEVWVKFRLIPTDPWIGQATWAFVTLPKIKLALAPFRLVNLMAIPFLSIFLAKLLTEDLPMLFVRPNRNVVDFLNGRAIGPVSKDFKDRFSLDGSSFFTGELSVTLIECRKLSYIPYLKTDPYVIFVLGEQVMRSKKNSQTSIIGPPGAPVWNQDFKLLVVDQKTQRLSLTVHDTIGFTSYPVGSADIDLTTLQDTVPVDRKLVLKSGWGPFPKRFAGEIILRLTYKAYIDEEGQEIPVGPGDGVYSNNASELVGSAVEQVQEVATFFKEEAGKVAEFFQEKDLAREMFSSLNAVTSTQDVEAVLPFLDPETKEGELASEPEALKEVANPAEAKELATVLSNGQAAADTIATEVNSIDEKGTSLDISPASTVKPTQNQEKVVVAETTKEETSGFLWLAALTGLILLVALDLNFSNVLNP